MRPIAIVQGTDVNFVLPVYETLVTDGLGNPIEDLSTRKDLTGASVLYRIGLVGVPHTALEKAGSVDDPAQDGVIRVLLTNEETGALTPADHDHQFIVTDSSGNRSVVRRGRVTVHPILPAP